MLTKRANECWRASFASRTPPRSADIKGERLQSHIQLFASEPSLSVRISDSVYKTACKCWCHGASAEVAVQCCCFCLLTACCSSSFCGRVATPPGRFSTFSKKANLKEQSKRAPRASDQELTAMLSWAAESVGLHWRPPPFPKRSRLDDWFLGAQANRRQPPPVPFFPEVHEEVTWSWKAPFSAQNRASASSILTTLDALPAKRHRLVG